MIRRSANYPSISIIVVALCFWAACDSEKKVENPASPPAAPNGVMASAISPSSVVLQWDDRSDNESSFSIFRGESGPFHQAGTTGADENAFVDSLLEDTTEYAYYVVALNQFGSSAPSETVTVTTPSFGFSPNAPSNPFPSDESTNLPRQLLLSWQCSDPDGDPLTYDVFFGLGPYLYPADSNLQIAKYDPGPLQFGTEYNWKVTAKDDNLHRTEGAVWHFTTEDSMFSLSVVVDGEGFVTVEPDLPRYAYADSVTLAAVPDSGWYFNGWGGDTSGTQNPLLLTMTGDLLVTAEFLEIPDSTVAIVTGTVSWPEHNLSPHTYAFADSFIYPNFYVVDTVMVNPSDGYFSMTFEDLQDTVFLEFQAHDDVNDNGPWNPIDSIDGWGFYDANGDSSRNDHIPIYPGARFDNIDIILSSPVR